jgi:hypothetical protein
MYYDTLRSEVRVNVQFTLQFFPGNMDPVLNCPDGDVKFSGNLVVFEAPEVHHKWGPVRIVKVVYCPSNVFLGKRRVRQVIGTAVG